MPHNLDDEDEKSLFQSHMRDVKPLKKTEKISHVSEKTLRPKQKPLSVETIKSFPLSNPYTIDTQAETRLSYHQAGLTEKRLKQLKKGEFSIERCLDLHGLHVNGASHALTHFILNAYKQGLRYLLIIHGKGGQHSDVAVLKSHVAHWLKQFPEVLAFHSAQAKDGGAGALYVLLKKQRLS